MVGTRRTKDQPQTTGKQPAPSKAGTPAGQGKTTVDPKKPAARTRKQGEDTDSQDDDDFEYNEDELQPPLSPFVKPASAGGSVSSGGSQRSRSRLDLSVEKQLLTDIEREPGGLHFFDEGDRLLLGKLLDKRKNLYGTRDKKDKKLRERISRRVTYLKSLHLHDYIVILQNYSIEPAALTATQRKSLSSKKKGTPLKSPHLRRPDTVKPVPEEAVSDLDDEEDQEVVSCPGSSEKSRKKPALNTPSKRATKPNLVSSLQKKVARHPDSLLPHPKEEDPAPVKTEHQAMAYAMKCVCCVFVVDARPALVNMVNHVSYLAFVFFVFPLQHLRGTQSSRWILISLGTTPRVFL